MQHPTITAESLLTLAETNISRGLLAEAEEALQRLVKQTPSKWQSAAKLPDGNIQIAFWNEQEYHDYLLYFKEQQVGKVLTHVYPSYAKAYYLLSALAVEQKDLSRASVYINRALELEPDHPEILCEKALIMNHLGHLKDAYELYVNAVYSRAWNSNMIQAKAMRGAGIVLEELGNLDAAAVMLKKSLQLEPANQVAMNELSHIYLQRMTQQNNHSAVTRPWWKFWQKNT